MADFSVSLLLTILLAPLMILLALINALVLGGTPFFKQPRLGKGGALFNIYKFRTFRMGDDYESVNKFGRFLRASSLDEIPQLINILLGHMSFVGPRPLLSEYKGHYTEKEWTRHEVKPGLTGLAQVSLGNSSDWVRRMDFDVEYLNKISFWFDLKVLILTILLPFKARNNSNVEIERFDEFSKRR